MRIGLPRIQLVLCWALALGVAASTDAAAQTRARVGLIPFDVASVDGGTRQAATAMAKLVRAQMITSRTLQPVLIELPAGETLPLPEDRLASLVAAHKLDLIVAGTILDANTTRGSNRVSTGSLGGVVGVGGVGGSVTKTRAEVRLHVEVVDAEGRTTQAFEVEGDNTDVGIGADLWTTLGSFDVGEPSWDKSPMGKALREAAEKLVSDVQKRRR
jgi:curli biogenesis system outer membrane secretion channel CsgG